MGVYSEYLDRNMSFQVLSAERKIQLARISKLRGDRDMLVYAADARKHRPPEVSAMIHYDDLLPISDQLSNLNGSAIDVILETPGGVGEVTEDIVRQLRHKSPNDVAFIVPGMAKSAGTIMVMSGNEIPMDANSSLGPSMPSSRGKERCFRLRHSWRV
jgi:ClpP class serine protease